MTQAPVAQPPPPVPWGLPLLAAAACFLGPMLGFVLFLTQLEKEAGTLGSLFEGAAPAQPDPGSAGLDETPRPPPVPVAKADLLNVSAFGAHSLAQVKNALGASTEPLQECVLEATGLPTTLHVELAVNAAGEVATLVTEGTDLGWCVREALGRVEFPELDKAALSLVRLDVKFTSLPKK